MNSVKFKKAIFGLFGKVKVVSLTLKKLKLYDSDQAKSTLRTIYINNTKPSDYNDSNEIPYDYKSNRIKTSKYNLLTFIPKNLFEQFRRITNLYFLINNIINIFLPDPPTNPFLGIIPITLLIIATSIKQGYEDIWRHKYDNQINNLPVRILRNGKFENLKWKDIKCGDIVEINAETQIPCDLVLLHSDTSNGICFKTTANLDGETNLKRRSIPSNFPTLKTESEFSNLRGVIKCDKPNLRLYEFSGKIILNGQQYPIVNENILLRGSTLKIAPVIYGCAIYTGQETKMMLNSKFKSNKFSSIEKKLNIYTVVFFIFLALLTFITFFATLAYDNLYSNHWYLAGRQPLFFVSNHDLYNFIILITIMNMLNYVIPLPTYVCFELQRFIGSQFIEWDLEMYDEKTNQPAKANTSDLNEDLGQIEYLFSDKTGTLTENEMEFKQFSINESIYEERNGEIYQIGSSDNIDLVNVRKKL
jgi:phospholipid-translocating ATPase